MKELDCKFKMDTGKYCKNAEQMGGITIPKIWKINRYL